MFTCTTQFIRLQHYKLMNVQHYDCLYTEKKHLEISVGDCRSLNFSFASGRNMKLN